MYNIIPVMETGQDEVMLWATKRADIRLQYDRYLRQEIGWEEMLVACIVMLIEENESLAHDMATRIAMSAIGLK